LSIGVPEPTGPLQEATPEPLVSSVQPKSAVTVSPAVNVAPSAGVLIRASGASLSTTLIVPVFERTSAGSVAFVFA
jgi:hypothetical protein